VPWTDLWWQERNNYQSQSLAGYPCRLWLCFIY